MRIFTNDDAAANALVRADGRLEVTAWFDPMAFGRLPQTQSLEGYAVQRAQALAEAGWEEAATAEADFQLRFASLQAAAADAYADAALLFGGSLVDQLQLAQILAWLAGRPEQEQRRFRMMVVDGPLSIFDDGALLEVAREGSALDDRTIGAYRSAWEAVTAPDPMGVAAVFGRLRTEGEHPALASALERWLQELPSWDNGLSITEGQILDAARLGASSPQALFEAVEETEAAPFRLNWEMWAELGRLCGGGDPLLQVPGGGRFLQPPLDLAWTAFHAQSLELTDLGQAVLEGERHAAGLARPERWLGGARVGPGGRWYWNYGTRSIEPEPNPLAPTLR